jgi:hypothetical protein
VPRFCAASAGSIEVGVLVAGSVRGMIATGSLYMKPEGGDATLSHSCVVMLNM